MSESSKIVRQSGELSLLKSASDRDDFESNGDLCGWAHAWLTFLCNDIEHLEFVLEECQKVAREQEARLQANSKALGEAIIEDMKTNKEKFLPPKEPT